MSSLPRVILKNSSCGYPVLIPGILLLLGAAPSVAQTEAEVKATPGVWERLGPSGSLRAAYWNRDRSYQGRRHYLASSAWLNLRPEEVLGFKLVLEGYVASNDTTKGAQVFTELREAYVERSLGDFDFKAGRQIVVWGRADKLNPTDVWSSKNLTLLATDDEDQRLGALGASITWNLGEVRVSGLYQPEWRFPIYPIPPISGVELQNLQPVEGKHQFGFKIDRQSSDWDGSISYARVISRTPSLPLLGAGPSGARVGLQFNQIEMFGADFATAVGSWGLRGEAAYTLGPDRDGSQATQWNREVFAVVGGEHSPFEDFNVNFQLLYKHVLDFRSDQDWSDANTRNLALQQNLVANQLRQNQFGFSVRPSVKFWNETLELEAAYVQWLGVPGGLVRPKVTYAWSDQLKVIAGSESYFGDSNSFFGRLSSISSVFAELRYGF